MDSHQTKRKKYNFIFKVDAVTGEEYYVKWFESGREKRAQSQLEKYPKEDVPPELMADYNNAQTYVASSGMEYIERVLRLGGVSKDPYESFYIAYREMRSGELDMAIIYVYDSYLHSISVEYMSISAQGVLKRLDTWKKTGTILKREKIFQLFTDSLKAMREVDPELDSIRITVASKGSSNAVNLVWGRNTSNFNGNDGEEELFESLPFPTTCMNCQVNEAIHSLKHVGGGFCSERCARGAWKILKFMEHPLVDKYDF